MPKGYIVANLEITNRGEEFLEYRDKVLATIEQHGGRFLVRGGDPLVLEGEAAKGPLIVIEFESREKAMAWYNAVEYQTILPLRLRNASGWLTCATGL